ncbi:DUF2332 domain-containing protein [Nocardioides aestuarii]|uniref:DUF2332 domain-containing protein n=1 Tax=Nocardioides aestuarii TaxID=252231 RepID=A0ABW4TN51_9ACTN
MELFTEVARQYSDFADYAGDSPCFEDWARQVASDPEVQAWIAALPPIKQQPNLVFAAARWHGVPAPGPYAGLRDALLADDGTIVATIRARATQTNEVGRLATLTPFLAEVAAQEGAPLALLEVGPSAGLCLYPDRWSYAWSTAAGTVRAGVGPELPCEVTGALPAPVLASGPPAVAWRGGVDLNPLDVTDADAMAWLQNLVWPEQDERRERLRTAVEVARPDPPHLVAGDLLTELEDLVEEAAAHGPVVVFHTAVIAYLEPPDRERFHDLATGLVADGRIRWVSNEGRRVLPRVTATASADGPASGAFVLGVDGVARAFTHGHGAAMTVL